MKHSETASLRSEIFFLGEKTEDKMKKWTFRKSMFLQKLIFHWLCADLVFNSKVSDFSSKKQFYLSQDKKKRDSKRERKICSKCHKEKKHS